MIDNNNEKVPINLAANTFLRKIPYKIYSLTNDKITTKKHTHDYMQIWYIMSGSCEHLINNKCHTLAKGNLFVLPPFAIHEIKAVEGQDIRIIGCEFLIDFVGENISLTDMDSSLFDFTYLEPFLVSTDAVLPRLHLTGKSQIKVEELLLDMLSEYEREMKYYEINIKADLLKLLAIAAREYENQGNPEHNKLYEKYRDAIFSAINFVEKNYTSKLYIEDVCKIAMMSQAYFSRLFKFKTGKTFVEYINSLRIRKAIELLRESDATATDICFSVGFNDITYFNRVFKKETGLSPIQYKHASRDE